MENENGLPPEIASAAQQLHQVDIDSGLTDDPNAVVEPTESEQEKINDKLEFDAATAAFTAQMGLSALEGMMKMVLHPRFEFSQSSKSEALEKFSPMLCKYGLLLPEIVMRYREEIEAGKAAVGLVRDGYGTVCRLRQEDQLAMLDKPKVTENKTKNEGEVTDVESAAA